MLAQVFKSFPAEYFKTTPVRARLCDAFVLFCVTLAALQYAYMKIAGDFPYNSFLAGFFCCVGTATLTACLRLQLENKSAHSAFTEYKWCCLLLFLVTFNYLG